MRPLHSYIALRVDKAEEKTESGLYLVKSEDARMERGTVVEVGTGRITTSGLLIPPSVKPGDRVIFRDIALKRNGKWYNPQETDDLYFIDDSDIMAVIEEDDAPIEAEGEAINLDLSQVAYPAGEIIN